MWSPGTRSPRRGDALGAAFQDGNSGHETARVLHNAAERLVALQARYGALDIENPSSSTSRTTPAHSPVTSARSLCSPDLSPPRCSRRCCCGCGTGVYRLMCEEQARDRDNDGIPDIYERG